MEARDHLPDLPTLVPGHERRRHRRPRRASSRRLDYLVRLGVDAIWISPIYPSPMADFGYDISDYCGIDPVFGTLTDFERLIDEAHHREHQGHPRLRAEPHVRPASLVRREPQSSRDSAKRDWYIWRDAQPGRRAAQQLDQQFRRQRVDLRRDDRTVLLSRVPQGAARPQLAQPGCARRDARRACASGSTAASTASASTCIWHLMKDEALRDNPVNPGYAPGQPDINRLLQVHSADQPEIARGGRRNARASSTHIRDRVLIGEIYLPLQRLVAYYGRDLDGRPAAVQLPAPADARGTPSVIAALIDEYEARACPPAAGPTGCSAITTRSASRRRVGAAQARVAAMLLLTLRGTPTLYYGDEIGMTDVPIPADGGAGPLGEERARPRLRPRSAAHADAVGQLRVRRLHRTVRPGCRSPPTILSAQRRR